MPRYFFHIRDGEYLLRDDEGMILTSDFAVKIEAYASACDVARQTEYNSRGCSVEVTDESGAVIDRVAVPLFNDRHQTSPVESADLAELISRALGGFTG